MHFGSGAMKFEHILEIAAYALNMVPFIMFEVVKKLFRKNFRRGGLNEKEQL